MKKFMKKLAKKAEGFTLVELVVVIAILGILAGIAIPAYSGYLSKANDAACLAELEAIEVAAQAAASMSGKSVDTITVTKGGVITVAFSPAFATGDHQYTEFYNANANLAKLMAAHSEFGADANDGAMWTSSTDWKSYT